MKIFTCKKIKTYSPPTLQPSVTKKPLTKCWASGQYLYRYVNNMARNCCHPLVVADDFSLWNHVKENISFHWFYFSILALWLWPPDSMHDGDFLSRSPTLTDIRLIDIPSGSQFFSLKSNAKGDKAVTTY